MCKGEFICIAYGLSYLLANNLARVQRKKKSTERKKKHTGRKSKRFTLKRLMNIKVKKKVPKGTEKGISELQGMKNLGFKTVH